MGMDAFVRVRGMRWWVASPVPFSVVRAGFPLSRVKKALAIVPLELYLAVQTTVHRFCTFNGSVGSEGLLWNGQQALVTAVIVEGQHPLPDLLAIKRQ